MLVIVAASHLDAVTFQICSQSFKIMPTAFFAVWLLNQYLTPLQWGSLPVLAVGVVFVTMNGSTPAGEPPRHPKRPESLNTVHRRIRIGLRASTGPDLWHSCACMSCSAILGVDQAMCEECAAAELSPCASGQVGGA